MASIAIKGLTKSFNAGDDAPAAVADLDLDIKDNQFVTLLGPSGCGKTTTLRMIAGYIVPDAGSIHINGRLLSAPGSVVPPDQRGMGMVFQNYAVWPHKTVYENVVFGLKVRKTPSAEAKKYWMASPILLTRRSSRPSSSRTSRTTVSSGVSPARAPPPGSQ